MQLQLDPFKHPLVGTYLEVETESTTVKWTCHAWIDKIDGKDAGSCWYCHNTEMYYTNAHYMWEKIIGPQYPGYGKYTK